jgi:hypothetical protein
VKSAVRGVYDHNIIIYSSKEKPAKHRRTICTTYSAIPGDKNFSINTKEYSTILASFNVRSPYQSYNTLHLQRSAKRNEVPGPERRAVIAGKIASVL